MVDPELNKCFLVGIEDTYYFPTQGRSESKSEIKSKLSQKIKEFHLS